MRLNAARIVGVKYLNDTMIAVSGEKINCLFLYSLRVVPPEAPAGSPPPSAASTLQAAIPQYEPTLADPFETLYLQSCQGAHPAHLPVASFVDDHR